MNIDNRDSYLIFFGNKEESLLLNDVKESRFSLQLQNLAQDYGLQKLVVLNQVHGAAGLVVKKNFFSVSGSQIKFWMTDQEKEIYLSTQKEPIKQKNLLKQESSLKQKRLPHKENSTKSENSLQKEKSSMNENSSMIENLPLVIPDLIRDPVIKSASWFEHQGDFLMTDQKNIGLVILTADCTPLVLYDFASHAVCVVHAGWKGSFDGVLQETLQAMQKNYGTDFKNLKCSFGPSARSCCYEVSELFVRDFEKKYSDVVSFTLKNSKYYFDNSVFLQQLLKKFGIPEQNIYTDNALCTICNPQFCSFRKEKERANRQITMVALF
ncbi:polyphenol oxidase family protein [Candidatus Babeliales bacterium]|nr:polyphenol oxidase family protein [Candidatus Babeliales bacterium]